MHSPSRWCAVRARSRSNVRIRRFVRAIEKRGERRRQVCVRGNNKRRRNINARRFPPALLSLSLSYFCERLINHHRHRDSVECPLFSTADRREEEGGTRTGEEEEEILRSIIREEVYKAAIKTETSRRWTNDRPPITARSVVNARGERASAIY